MSSAHCSSEGKEECRSCLRIACPVQWGTGAQSPPGAPAALGAWTILRALVPLQTLPLQQGWLRWGMRILESALGYQEEILLALFSWNLCLLDSGQCPKGVCCPWVCYLHKERTFSQPEQGTSPFPLTSVCVSAFEPVGNAFYFVPWTVVDSSSPERTGWREEGQGDSLTVVSRVSQTLF